MKITKRIISVLSVIAVCIAILPVSGFALPVIKTEGAFTYTVENGYAVICNYDGSVTGELVIPEKLGGYPVGGITRWKFQYDSKITSVVLPEGFLFLGELAFASCENLENVTIPQSLCGVGRGVFSGTPWYNSLPQDGDIYIGNVLAAVDKNSTDKEIIVKEGTTGIADYLFIGNTQLEKIILPESCKYIGEYAFNGCSALKEIDMPDAMIHIGQYAFGNCSSLESFTVPKGLNAISNALLAGASSLKEISIPEGIKDIGDGAFTDCALTSVVIPDGTERIKSMAFMNCSELCEITIPASMKIIESSAFFGCDKLSKLNYSGTDEQYSSIVLDNKYNESFVALKEQNTEIQKNIVYAPCSFEKDTMNFPRGLSVADYRKALFEPFQAVAKPDNSIYTFEEELSIIANRSIVEKGLESLVIGDADKNGKINAADARTALRASVGLENVNFERIYIVDVDNDKAIRASDARMILRASVGLEDASLWK